MCQKIIKYVNSVDLFDSVSNSNFWGLSGLVKRNENTYTTNGKGDVSEKYAGEEKEKTYYYDAFGNEKNVTNDNNPFRYVGEYFDEESGLIYLRNRYYNSSTGRFITEDPTKDGLNWYSYCGGNPVNFVDPWGLEYGKLRDFVDDYYNTFSGKASLEFGELNGRSFVYVTLGEYERAFYFDGTIVEGYFDGVNYTEERIKVADNIDGTLWLQRSVFVSAMGMVEDGTATITISDEMYVDNIAVFFDLLSHINGDISNGSDIKDLMDILKIHPTAGKITRNLASAYGIFSDLGGGKLLVAGNYQAESILVQNPYFSPYSYRVDTLYGVDDENSYYEWCYQTAIMFGFIPEW